MATPQVTLNSFGFGAVVRSHDTEEGLEINFRVDYRQIAEATDAPNSVSVPEEAIHEYQSIIPLKGKYINDPSWDDLPMFLERYWREIEGNDRD